MHDDDARNFPEVVDNSSIGGGGVKHPIPRYNF